MILDYLFCYVSMSFLREDPRALRNQPSKIDTIYFVSLVLWKKCQRRLFDGGILFKDILRRGRKLFLQNEFYLDRESLRREKFAKRGWLLYICL